MGNINAFVIAGCILTFRHEMFSETGRIIFKKGQRVKIKKPIIQASFVGKGSGMYYPATVTGVKLVGKRGDYSLDLFEETAKK